MGHPLSRRSFFRKSGFLASGAAFMPLGSDAHGTKLPNSNPGSFLNVLDAGAKGDGITDDTGAIQEAILLIAKKGGGKIYFPYTSNGYKIARPAMETVDGKPCRSQLYFPNGTYNIALEGEQPCSLLYTYQVRTNTRFEMRKINTFLFSTWEAPEETDPTARPWSLLSAVEGDSLRGRFGVTQVSVKNLEFRTFMNTEKMYPTSSGLFLKNAARVNIQDSQICLDKNVGDVDLNKELLPNPNHVVGLMTSGDQNDNQVLRNVAVQGYRYGFLFGEHTVADYLYVHNCEEAIVFHDSTHLSHIQHIVAQHNQKILTSTREALFGTRKDKIYLRIEGIDFEAGKGTKPEVSIMKFGVYDPENRLHGYLRWHCGFPPGDDFFPVEGGRNITIQQF
ncbi:MAG: glycosyl hydrolase family 28-related protein [Mariniphaga sp.]|nr:glycosyl hydrolase family 28-related protein [Mariniphaga sp.]